MEITDKIKETAYSQYKIMSKFNSLGTPTYSFEIGQEVKVGNLDNCIVKDIIVDKDNGLQLYGIEFDARKNSNKNNTSIDNSGREFGYWAWYNVRPVNVIKDTNLTKKDNIDIRFYNTTIESLLSKYYLHGLDLNPDYQRDYVWEDSDKESLIDSIFNGIEIGKFALIKHDYSEDLLYEILDGKQRLTTLLDFYENRISYKGYYFNELSFMDKHTFLNTEVTLGETSDLTKQEIYEYFVKLNTTGKSMDEEHLKKIKEMINITELSELNEEGTNDIIELE